MTQGSEKVRELLTRAKDALYNSFEPDNQCKLWYDIEAFLAAPSTSERVVALVCESCKSTNTERYENDGGLKMYVCRDCGWHHEAPLSGTAIVEKLREQAHYMESPYWTKMPAKPTWEYVAKAFREIASDVEAALAIPSAAQVDTPQGGQQHGDRSKKG